MSRQWLIRLAWLFGATSAVLVLFAIWVWDPTDQTYAAKLAWTALLAGTVAFVCGFAAAE